LRPRLPAERRRPTAPDPAFNEPRTAADARVRRHQWFHPRPLPHSLTETAQREGYRLTLFSAGSDAGEIHQYKELLQVADIDGFVITGTHHGDGRTAWLMEHDIPFAAFGRPWSDTEDPYRSRHAWVDVDGGAGTAQATEYFLREGHVSIGSWAGPPVRARGTTAERLAAHPRNGRRRT
jgi:DNA-binding LacI/PurR family transcriptional regulator